MLQQNGQQKSPHRFYWMVRGEVHVHRHYVLLGQPIQQTQKNPEQTILFSRKKIQVIQKCSLDIFSGRTGAKFFVFLGQPVQQTKKYPEQTIK